jgi:hypothetical protein
MITDAIVPAMTASPKMSLALQIFYLVSILGDLIEWRFDRYHLRTKHKKGVVKLTYT